MATASSGFDSIGSPENKGKSGEPNSDSLTSKLLEGTYAPGKATAVQGVSPALNDALAKFANRSTIDTAEKNDNQNQDETLLACAGNGNGLFAFLKGRKSRNANNSQACPQVGRDVATNNSASQSKCASYCVRGNNPLNQRFAPANTQVAGDTAAAAQAQQSEQVTTLPDGSTDTFQDYGNRGQRFIQKDSAGAVVNTVEVTKDSAGTTFENFTEGKNAGSLRAKYADGTSFEKMPIAGGAREERYLGIDGKAQRSEWFDVKGTPLVSATYDKDGNALQTFPSGATRKIRVASGITFETIPTDQGVIEQSFEKDGTLRVPPNPKTEIAMPKVVPVIPAAQPDGSPAAKSATPPIPAAQPDGPPVAKESVPVSKEVPPIPAAQPDGAVVTPPVPMAIDASMSPKVDAPKMPPVMDVQKPAPVSDALEKAMISQRKDYFAKFVNSDGTLNIDGENSIGSKIIDEDLIAIAELANEKHNIKVLKIDPALDISGVTEAGLSKIIQAGDLKDLSIDKSKLNKDAREFLDKQNSLKAKALKTEEVKKVEGPSIPTTPKTAEPPKSTGPNIPMEALPAPPPPDPSLMKPGAIPETAKPGPTAEAPRVQDLSKLGNSAASPDERQNTLRAMVENGKLSISTSLIDEDLEAIAALPATGKKIEAIAITSNSDMSKVTERGLRQLKLLNGLKSLSIDSTSLSPERKTQLADIKKGFGISDAPAIAPPATKTPKPAETPVKPAETLAQPAPPVTTDPSDLPSDVFKPIEPTKLAAEAPKPQDVVDEGFKQLFRQDILDKKLIVQTPLGVDDLRAITSLINEGEIDALSVKSDSSGGGIDPAGFDILSEAKGLKSLDIDSGFSLELKNKLAEVKRKLSISDAPAIAPPAVPVPTANAAGAPTPEVPAPKPGEAMSPPAEATSKPRDAVAILKERQALWALRITDKNLSVASPLDDDDLEAIVLLSNTSKLENLSITGKSNLNKVTDSEFAELSKAYGLKSLSIDSSLLTSPERKVQFATIKEKLGIVDIPIELP